MKWTHLLTAAVMAGSAILPVTASAQDRHRSDQPDRKPSKSKNDRERKDNDRWDRNNGHDNGRHNGNQDRYDNRRDRDRRDDWRNDDRRNDNRRNDDRRDDDWRRDNRWNSGWDDWSGRDWRDDVRWRGSEYDRRQETKNEWRNLGIAAGLLGVLGLLEHDKTLVFTGTAGALYSAYRYEQDRKSQNRLDRARAHYFGEPYFIRDGRRYDRRTVTHNGQKYYQFVRAR